MLTKIKSKSSSIFCVIFCSILLLFVSGAHPAEYNRAYFKHWSDLDRNGYDTRYDVLRAQTVGVAKKQLTPLFVCPYTGVITTISEELDIDHVVPLKYAWEHGADKWTTEKRELFANDHENLLVVLSSLNRAKGAKGPEEWLPPNVRYIKPYTDKFILVCVKYGLDCDINSISKIPNKYNKHLKGIISDNDRNFTSP